MCIANLCIALICVVIHIFLVKNCPPLASVFCPPRIFDTQSTSPGMPLDARTLYKSTVLVTVTDVANHSVYNLCIVLVLEAL